MTLEATDRIAELEHKIDTMAAQMDIVVTELREQRLRRQQWEELVSDLAPISGEAMAMASRELEAVQEWVEPADIMRLLRRILRNTNNIEEGMATYESAMEFLSDAAPLTSQAFARILETLDQYERKGYFEFAGAGIGVLDRIVTSYSRDDVEALGDNVVHILDILKDLTQPEMLAVADRLLEAVRRQAELEALEPEEPPSLFALAGRVRDPAVRRGLGRALNTFKAVSAADSSSAVAAIDATTNDDSPEGGA